jgi:hypothetical protein
MSRDVCEPPRVLLQFLKWFCPPNLHESIEGDLREQWEADVREGNLSKANRKLVWNIVKFSSEIGSHLNYSKIL